MPGALGEHGGAAARNARGCSVATPSSPGWRRCWSPDCPRQVSVAARPGRAIGKSALGAGLQAPSPAERGQPVGTPRRPPRRPARARPRRRRRRRDGVRSLPAQPRAWSSPGRLDPYPKWAVRHLGSGRAQELGARPARRRCQRLAARGERRHRQGAPALLAAWGRRPAGRPSSSGFAANIPTGPRWPTPTRRHSCDRLLSLTIGVRRRRRARRAGAERRARRAARPRQSAAPCGTNAAGARPRAALSGLADEHRARRRGRSDHPRWCALLDDDHRGPSGVHARPLDSSASTAPRLGDADVAAAWPP